MYTPLYTFVHCPLSLSKIGPRWIRIDTKPRLRGFIPRESGEFFIKLARFIGPISPRAHRTIVGESSRWKSIPRGGNGEQIGEEEEERKRGGVEMVGRRRKVFLSPRKVWLTGIAQLKFDDRSSRSLPYFGGGRNPGLVGLALLQPRRLVVQVLRRQRTLNGLHLLALVQHPDMDGVLGENAVRSPRWQPRYHYRVLVTGHGLHALGRVRN